MHMAELMYEGGFVALHSNDDNHVDSHHDDDDDDAMLATHMNAIDT